MIAPLTVVSFWATKPYMEEADALRASLEAFGVFHVIEERPDAGSWVANCAQKAQFLRDMRDVVPGGMLWLDADARLVAPLPAFHECDLAYHRFRGRKLISGTLYFGNTLGARQILDRWCRTIQPGEWDQRALGRIVDERNDWRIERLPEELCWICDIGSADVKPVVVHTQASRRLKHRAAATP